MVFGCLLLCLVLLSGAMGRGDTQCEGDGCAPRPATLVPATSVFPMTPASLLPASTHSLTPANHTTPTPANHTTPTPANHTTPTPANHTTPTPANHTTPTPANHTTPTPANHTTPTPANHTTPTTANHTTPMPANHTTPMPANHTTPTPANHTTPTPANHTTPTPANHTTPTPANHTTPSPANQTTHSVPTTRPPAWTKGTYKVENKERVCAMATMKLELRVQYRVGKQEKWGSFFINPNRTKASGVCGNASVNMTLNFLEGFLKFRFRMNNKKKTYFLQQILAQLTYQFPGAPAPEKFAAHNSALALINTHLGHSFQCSKLSVEASVAFWVDMVDQQVQVFNIPPKQTYGPVDRR
ncbi:macrosialin-like isoform X2 [Narcine bancroftii]|uniref:macrosialin-like isoform X2 n=1 Tax=Narcine bancroftii TaxID=1343680 RepID=UPI003831E7BF